MTRAANSIALLVLLASAAPLAAQLPQVWPEHLTAGIEALDAGIWQPAADEVTSVFGRMKVHGTPGFWVYPAAWVSLKPPDDPSYQPVYDAIIAKFPFLAKQPESSLNVVL